MIVPRKPGAGVLPWLGEVFRTSRYQSAERAPAPVDPWHYVGEAGEPGFQSGPGWANAGGGRAPCSFCIDGQGIVRLRGYLEYDVPSLVGASNYIFRLPEPYRPPTSVVLNLPPGWGFLEVWGAAQIGDEGQLWYDPDPIFHTAATGELSLDGIAFRAR